MAIIMVGSGNSAKDLPDPSEMDVILQDIDAASTTRNANGTLIRNRVCGGAEAKRKINCTWTGLDMDEASRLMRLIGDTFFDLTYPDTYTGRMRTGKFYVGDRTCKFYKCDGDGANALMSSVTADFIEQ